MTSEPPDLEHLVKHREQLAFEQHLARSAYAYGVDLRRSAWIERSMLADPLMRTVDRRWNELTTQLRDVLVEPDASNPSNAVMDEVLALVRLLHAPWPALRVLSSRTVEPWPPVTPLGTTKGGASWLVLDVARLQQLSSEERRFLLASGLAHLQCGHGPLYAAHLMASRWGRFERAWRVLLQPWATVAVFSADRAGLLAVERFDAAKEALLAHVPVDVPWLPSMPNVNERVRALEEFSRSRLLTRLRMAGSAQTWTLAPNLRPPAPKQTEPEPPAAVPTEQAPRQHDDVVAQAEADGERLVVEQETAQAAREQREDELAQARARDRALADAWPLSRCDQRLTHRLGIL